MSFERILTLTQLSCKSGFLRKALESIFHQKSMRRPIDFMICGTQKGGTTALDTYLRKHPSICMARLKEVHFFDNEDIFKRPHPDYSAYHSFFELGQDQSITGEATPIYMYWDPAPRRIWEYNPKMKIIVILRNPIDRAYSHWNMERSRNADSLSFMDALAGEQERCRKALPLQHRVYSYMDRGRYMSQLRRLWYYFTKERVLILRQENLRNSPAATLSEVFQFLGVEPYDEVGNEDVHSISYKEAMSGEARKFLRSVFECEIRELEKALGWDCSNWLS